MGTIYTQLSLESRTMIHIQLEMSLTPAAIALGSYRSASTLSREAPKNGWTRPALHRVPDRPPVTGATGPAHTRARSRAVTPRGARRRRPDTVVWKQRIRDLRAGYSPEQIAGTLARAHADTPALQVSHDTIYPAI